MASVIAYDLSVRDFIAGLDATGHVSHTQHRKNKVTLHHNGGRLSHEGVLSVWQVRPASAHFNVDAGGTVAQFVRINEYAWATGSTPGNQDSISIEMCNETVGPEWKVGEATWKGSARLAGWIFARVIGARPTRDTLVRHKYWSATECAGPYIDKVYEQILSYAQQSYDAFVSGGVPPLEGVQMTYEQFAEYLTRWFIFSSRPRGGRASHEDGPTLPETMALILTKLDILHSEVSDDEANIIAVMRQLGGTLPPEQQAELIRSRVDQSVWLAVQRLARGE